MAPVTTVNQLSGRENELRSLEDFLERAAAAPSVLVLSGEAGIGKTELWQAGLQQAGARGTRVLAHRAVEAEAALSFAGIGELLSPVAADVLPALDEPRRPQTQTLAHVTNSSDRSCLSRPGRAYAMSVD